MMWSWQLWAVAMMWSWQLWAVAKVLQLRLRDSGKNVTEKNTRVFALFRLILNNKNLLGMV